MLLITELLCPVDHKLYEKRTDGWTNDHPPYVIPLKPIHDAVSFDVGIRTFKEICESTKTVIFCLS